MRFCMNCGTEVPDGAKFCPRCGSPIAKLSDQPEQVAVHNVVKDNENTVKEKVQRRLDTYMPESKKKLQPKNKSIILFAIIFVVVAVCIIYGIRIDKNRTVIKHDDGNVTRTDSNQINDVDDDAVAEKGAFEGNATIKNTTILDEKGVKISVNNLTYGDSEANMDIKIENNTSKDLSFISGSIGYSCNSVNGYAVSGIYVNEDVTAGNKSSTSVSIPYDELEAMGITDIAEIQIGFEIEDSDYDDYLVTGPKKIKTSSVSSYDMKKDTYQKALKNGTFEMTTGHKVVSFKKGGLYSGAGMKVISAAVIDKDGNQDVLIEIENTSEEVLTLSVDDFAINNLVVSPTDWTSETVNPGEKGILDVDVDNMLDAEEYATLDIGDISNVAFHASVNTSKEKSLKSGDIVKIDFYGKKTKIDNSGKEIYNKNGVRILDDGSADTDDLYYYELLKIYNSTKKTIYVNDEYDTTSVNGNMVDVDAYGTTVEPGQVGLMKYGIDKDSLKQADINLDDIKTIKFQLNIGSGSDYNYIDKPKLTIKK